MGSISRNLFNSGEYNDDFLFHSSHWNKILRKNVMDEKNEGSDTEPPNFTKNEIKNASFTYFILNDSVYDVSR